jgi:hypothetical protein
VPWAKSVSPGDDLAKQISSRLFAGYRRDLVIVHGGVQALGRRSPWRAGKSVSRPERIWTTEEAWATLGACMQPGSGRGLLPPSLDGTVSSELSVAARVAVSRKETRGHAS